MYILELSFAWWINLAIETCYWHNHLSKNSYPAVNLRFFTVIFSIQWYFLLLMDLFRIRRHRYRMILLHCWGAASPDGFDNVAVQTGDEHWQCTSIYWHMIDPANWFLPELIDPRNTIALRIFLYLGHHTSASSFIHYLL